MSTRYVDPTGMQMWERSSRGRCVWCGENHLDNCYVRFCDWCTRHWLADTSVELDEHGPRFEVCPDCIAWEQAGCPQECVALVKFNKCCDCGQGCVGSWSAATGWTHVLCQKCRDYSNAKIESATRAFAWAVRIAA